MRLNLEEVFLQGRIAEEIELSDDSADVAAAQTHRQMAALYAARLSELRDRTPVITTVAPSIQAN